MSVECTLVILTQTLYLILLAWEAGISPSAKWRMPVRRESQGKWCLRYPCGRWKWYQRWGDVVRRQKKCPKTVNEVSPMRCKAQVSLSRPWTLGFSSGKRSHSPTIEEAHLPILWRHYILARWRNPYTIQHMLALKSVLVRLDQSLHYTVPKTIWRLSARGWEFSKDSILESAIFHSTKEGERWEPFCSMECRASGRARESRPPQAPEEKLWPRADFLPQHLGLVGC